MAKRKTIKLTEKVKAKIRSDYAKLRLSDYDGEALTYLKKVRGAAKGRKAQRDSVAVFGEFKVPKDSELYQIILKAAKAKKMTVAAFVKKYKKELIAVAEEGDFVQQRETEYLIDDLRKLKKGKKVFVNDGNGYTQTPVLKDILNIQQFTQHIVAHTEIFLIIYRVHYKTTGDISHYLPSVDEYEELEEPEEIESMLDSYYPEITYLRSNKGKDATPKEEKIIGKDSQERKAASAKARANDRKKRKKLPKPSKKK